MAINFCNDCYEIELFECPDEIEIHAPEINAGQIYQWVFTDKFGNKYSSESTGQAGVLIIDVENSTVIPDELFNQHAGTFKLELFTAYQDSFTFKGTVYNCIAISFYKNSGYPFTAIIE